jgi:hypothetical protein
MAMALINDRQRFRMTGKKEQWLKEDTMGAGHKIITGLRQLSMRVGKNGQDARTFHAPELNAVFAYWGGSGDD